MRYLTIKSILLNMNFNNKIQNYFCLFKKKNKINKNFNLYISMNIFAHDILIYLFNSQLFVIVYIIFKSYWR